MESGLSVMSLLASQELSIYEDRYGTHPGLEPEEELQLVDAVFGLRNYCWRCARRTIGEKMGWNFDLLSKGIPLDQHWCYDYLKDCRSVSKEWYQLFLWGIKTHRLEGFGDQDFVELLQEYGSKGVTPEIVKLIAEWFHNQFNEPLDIEYLNKIVNAGFRDSEDLILLSYSETIDALYIGWPLPSKTTLAALGKGMETYHAYQRLLWKFDEDAIELDIEGLARTGIEISFLENLVDGFLQDGVLDVVEADCEETPADGFHFPYPSLYEIFVSTVIALSETGLEVNHVNFQKFWGLPPVMVLYVIDNGLLAEDVMKIARMVKEPEVLSKWLSVDHENIPTSEVRSWVRAGFTADEAEKWKLAGFDAISASKWHAIVNDPIAARRRLDVGIQAPRTATT
jgi:hypothetical protein